MSRSTHRRRAAEAERRHYIVDAEPRSGQHRTNRLLVGGLIIIWFAGSIMVAYWLGEPYLRKQRNDVDPVQARLMADALSRARASGEVRRPESPRDTTGARIDALEQRVADAVLQIDAIRSGAATAADDEDLRKQIAELKAKVAASNREIARLQTANAATARHLDPKAGAKAAKVGPNSAEYGTDAASTTLAQRASSNDARQTHDWAMGAVGLSVLANLLTLWLFIARRRTSVATSKIRDERLETPAPIVPDIGVTPECEETTVADEDRPLTDANGNDAKDPLITEVASRMIDEMRNASVAGLETCEDEPGAETPVLVLVTGDGAPHVDKNTRTEVVLENRLGVKFAGRISDGERAGLAERRAAGDPERSVA